jgi:hypothetical protein
MGVWTTPSHGQSLFFTHSLVALSLVSACAVFLARYGLLNRCWGLTCKQGYFKITAEMVKPLRGRFQQNTRWIHQFTSMNQMHVMSDMDKALYTVLGIVVWSVSCLWEIPYINPRILLDPPVPYSCRSTTVLKEFSSNSTISRVPT